MTTSMTLEELPEAARAFVDGDVALLPAALDDAAGEALVALLVERGDATRLQRLGDGADKALGQARAQGAARPAHARRGGAQAGRSASSARTGRIRAGRGARRWPR